jgi:hypothetical protein
MEETVEVVTKEQVLKLSKVVPILGGPLSTLATSKTLGAEQATPMHVSSSASVALCRAKQHLKPALKVDDDEPEPEPEPETEKKAETIACA